MQPNPRAAPAIVTLSLQSKYYNAVASGAKTVEGRLAKPRLLGARIGDIVLFVNGADPGEHVYCRVKRVARYETFRSMLEAEGVERAVPGCTTVEEGVMAYYRLPGYKEGEGIHKVLAIQVELCTHAAC